MHSELFCTLRHHAWWLYSSRSQLRKHVTNLIRKCCTGARGAEEGQQGSGFGRKGGGGAGGRLSCVVGSQLFATPPGPSSSFEVYLFMQWTAERSFPTFKGVSACGQLDAGVIHKPPVLSAGWWVKHRRYGFQVRSFSVLWCILPCSGSRCDYMFPSAKQFLLWQQRSCQMQPDDIH